MLKVIVTEGLGSSDADAGVLRDAVKDVDVAAAAKSAGVSAESVSRIARDFARSKSGLAIGGGVAATGSNAVSSLVAINLLNAAVGAVGPRMRLGTNPALGRATPYAEMVKLTEAMKKGEIDVLVLVDVNPIYSMPPKAGFADALAKVPMVVALASRSNETTARAHVVLPTLHSLESWGDFEAEDGVIGLMQPTMGPVPIDGKPVDVRSTGDIFLATGRQALGDEEGKGPLKWAGFRALLDEEWQKRAKEYASGQAIRGVLGGVAQARRARGARRRPRRSRCGRKRAPRRIPSSSPATARTSSSRIRRCGSSTAETPTSPGSRRPPTRSPRSRGTSASRCRPRRRGRWGSSGATWSS